MSSMISKGLMLSVVGLMVNLGFTHLTQQVFALPLQTNESTIDGGYRQYNEGIQAQRPGIKVHQPPIQKSLSPRKRLFKNNYQLELTDEFVIQGLVLSKRAYIGDVRADISPMDLVLGWMKMSDPAILRDIGIRQNNRFYYWHVEQFPLPRKELEASSTNIHLIATDEKTAAALKLIRKGQIVQLSGHLVNVKAPDGFVWATSRSRDDEGDGACEILLVEQVEISQTD